MFVAAAAVLKQEDEATETEINRDETISDTAAHTEVDGNVDDGENPENGSRTEIKSFKNIAYIHT